jgi:hypothetical protein
MLVQDQEESPKPLPNILNLLHMALWEKHISKSTPMINGLTIMRKCRKSTVTSLDKRRYLYDVPRQGKTIGI